MRDRSTVTIQALHNLMHLSQLMMQILKALVFDSFISRRFKDHPSNLPRISNEVCWIIPQGTDGLEKRINAPS